LGNKAKGGERNTLRKLVSSKGDLKKSRQLAEVSEKGGGSREYGAAIESLFCYTIQGVPERSEKLALWATFERSYLRGRRVGGACEKDQSSSRERLATSRQEWGVSVVDTRGWLSRTSS